MTDPEIEMLARAAGTTTASPFDESVDESGLVPAWAAHLMVAFLAVVATAFLVFWGLTPEQLATLKS